MTNEQASTTSEPTRPLESMHRALAPILVAIGFAALAGAGKLDALSIVLTTAALLARLALEARHNPWRLSQRQSTALSLVYIFFYLADLFFLSNNFVTATVHLVLFGMCVKLHSITRERDYLYLGALSFLEMLAAAILTVDLVYMIALGFYLMLALLALMTMEMRRTAARSDAQIAWREGEGAHARAPKLLFSTAVAASLGIFLLGALIFFMLPRLSYGYLGKLTQAGNYSSGYGDSVSLNATGRIELNSQIVAHVRIDGDDSGSHQLRMRGAVMSSFNGKRWSSPLHNSEIYTTRQQGSFAIEGRASQQPQEMITHPGGPRALVHYNVLMEPIGSDALFLLDQPVALSGHFREISIDADNSVRASGGERMAAQYDGLSAMRGEDSAKSLELNAPPPATIPARYLQLPTLDARIAKLAAELAPTELAPADKARRLTLYLSTHYAYTLQLPDKDLDDPLADFLFVRKQGHCEYFASALAVMLRSVGVPSRVVTGFSGGEFNDVNHAYILRARDAHAWVEAWLPGRGWTSFDATPSASTAPVATGWRRSALYMDAMREYWREWIVNYDVSRQQSLAVNGATRARGGFERLRFWGERSIRSMQLWARAANRRIEGSPHRYILFSFALCALLTLGWQAPHLWRAMRELSLTRHPQKRPQQAATLWLHRVESLLRQRGVTRAPHVSAEEMTQGIADTELRRASLDFVRSYEAARFGASVEAAEMLPALYESVRQHCARRPNK